LACSTHGAIFEPDTGKCVAGPCRGASLEPMQVREREGQVFVEEPGPAIKHETTSRWTDPAAPEWERAILEKVALQAIEEQRRARQWKALFRLLWFAFAFLLLAAWLGWIGRPDKDMESLATGGKHTALVELEGVIGPDSKASSERMIKALNRAFKNPNTQGVVMRINSPGGSPVQAGYINDEMRRLRAKYPGIPLYAVVEDLCASGGYYVAVAADRIYVDKASLVGSIGAIMGGFGFVGSMEKLGIERRAYTAGTNKDFLDPSLPRSRASRAREEGCSRRSTSSSSIP
jgi:protease-4